MLGLALLGLLPMMSAAETASDIAARLEERMRALQSLEARFTHIFYGQPPSAPLREKGRFYFQTPSRMRWHYEDPEPKDYIYKEGTFYSFFPEDHQLIIQTLSGEYHEAELLLILAGQKQLRDDYDLELDPLSSPPGSGAWTLKLKPRAEGETSSEILLEVDGKTWLIRRAVFRDWAGNAFEFLFEGLKPDRRLDPGLFEIRVPDGWEVIRQDAPAPQKKQTKTAAVRIPQ